ncbi:hypothetical protein [Streptomyces sp. NPDC013489]|uniref:hypothetical protein n=1 Tax=Streptomyces sp. NPDC013489 TaxID=3155606 RepID=UPI0033C3093E
MTSFTMYDDWDSRGYLRGLEHGRFHEAPGIAALIEAAPALEDIRFRGEHLTVHASADGSVFAVLWEEWFGRSSSTWIRHPGAAAARSWTHQVAAQWLRNDAPYRSGGGSLQSWNGDAWAAERDLVHGRWALCTGLHPAVEYTSFETEDPATGWAFLREALTEAGFPVEQWPAAMQQTRLADLPVPAPAPAAPPSYWRRVGQTALLWWRAAFAPLSRAASKAQATAGQTH